MPRKVACRVSRRRRDYRSTAGRTRGEARRGAIAVTFGDAAMADLGRLHEALRSNPPATPTDVDITGVVVLTA